MLERLFAPANYTLHVHTDHLHTCCLHSPAWVCAGPLLRGEPATFTPATFTPVTFTPATFTPATFTPATFTPVTSRLSLHACHFTPASLCWTSSSSRRCCATLNWTAWEWGGSARAQSRLRPTVRAWRAWATLHVGAPWPVRRRVPSSVELKLTLGPAPW